MNINTTVEELIERVDELNRSFAIWSDLVSEEKRSERESIIEDYEDFFSTTAHAHFQTILIIISQLFDKRRDTKSFPNLNRSIQLCNPMLATEIDVMMKPYAQVLNKIRDIRGNIYAHRNQSQHPEEVFSRAGLTIAEMNSIVNLARQVVGLISQKTGYGSNEDLINEFHERAELCLINLNSIFHALMRYRGSAKL